MNLLILCLLVILVLLVVVLLLTLQLERVPDSGSLDLVGNAKPIQRRINGSLDGSVDDRPFGG